jgi:AraC-like DNA-binding protein
MMDMVRKVSFTPRSLSIVDEAREKIEKTIDYMKHHLSEPITREKLAALAGLNQEHYSRIFGKYKGISPGDYMTKLRIEEAKRLLVHSNKSILEISRLVGFGDPYYFSRRFKQMVGVAPSVYWKSPKQRIVALDCYGHCRALGIELIGAASHDISGYFTDGMGQAEDIGIEDEPYFELDKVRDLQPDVIITTRKDWELRLSDFASTVLLSVYEDPIYEQMFSIAKRLGKEKEALDWVRSYEEEASQLRGKVTERIGDGTVAVLRVREELLQIYGEMNMGYPLYHSLQLKPPEKSAQQSRINTYHHSSVITIEELPYYEADYLFVVLEPNSGAERIWEEIQASREWNAYPAVRSEQVYHVEVKRWLAYDPISIKEQMIEAASLLLR